MDSSNWSGSEVPFLTILECVDTGICADSEKNKKNYKPFFIRSNRKTDRSERDPAGPGPRDTGRDAEITYLGRCSDRKYASETMDGDPKKKTDGHRRRENGTTRELQTIVLSRLSRATPRFRAREGVRFAGGRVCAPIGDDEFARARVTLQVYRRAQCRQHCQPPASSTRPRDFKTSPIILPVRAGRRDILIFHGEWGTVTSQRFQADNFIDTTIVMIY